MPQGSDTIDIAISSRRITDEGYLIAQATLARAGTLVYLAKELELSDRSPHERVNVWRSASELERAAPTFENQPIVYGSHPSGAVTAQTWRKHAVGDVRGVVAADGMLSGTVIIRDAQAITGVERGTKQLSIGFSFDLAPLTPGHSSGCTHEQKALKGNHIAIVAAGRCGSSCVIGDDEPTTEGEHTMRIEIMGLPFDLPDAAAAAVQQQQAELERLRGADRSFNRDLAAYTRARQFATDCGCQVRDDLNTHQLRVEVLRRLSSNDAAIAEMIRAGCQGRDLDQASPEIVATVFEMAMSTKKERPSMSANDMRTATALAGGFSQARKGADGLDGRDAYIWNIEHAWEQTAASTKEEQHRRFAPSNYLQ